MRSTLTSLPLRRLSLAISVVICQAMLTCPVANAAEDNTSAAATDSTPGDPARLGEISVTGQLAAIRRAQAIKQDAVGVVDSVSAEEAGKFPDQNVADALQRVPGVAVDRSGGESSKVTVRGFGPSFVNVTVNGRPMLSDSGDRSFHFDALPSELISTAEVLKTASAGQEDGGIGGTINITTARPLDSSGFHMAGSLGAVNDSLDTGLANKFTPRGSFLIGDSNADHTFGWLVSAMYYKRNHKEDLIETGGWYVNQDFSKISSDPLAKNGAYPQTLDAQAMASTNTRKGLSVALDWKPFDKLMVKFDSLVTNYKQDYLTHYVGYYGNQPDTTAVTFDSNGTPLSFTRNTNNGAAQATDSVMTSNTPRDAYVTQTGLNVAYDITDTLKADLDIAYTGAWNKYDSGNTFLVVGTRNTGLPMNFTNPNNGNFPYYDYASLIQPSDSSNLMTHCCSTGGNHLSNKGDNYRLHLSKRFTDGVLSKLDFGVESTDTTLRQISYNTTYNSGDALNLCAIYCGYNASVPASAIGAGIFNAGGWFGQQSQGFPSQWLNYDMNKLLSYLLSPAAYNQIYDYRNSLTYATPEAKAAALKQVTDFAAAAAKFGGWVSKADPRTFSQIEEKTKSAYFSADFDGTFADMPWHLNTGYRYVKTDTTSDAYAVLLTAVTVNPSDPSNAIPTYGSFSPIQFTGSYKYWLPSANFKINVRDDLVVRFAASKTLTRPDLTQLAATTSYNFRPANQTITTGNTDLKPFLSKNIDAGIEWYFADASYVALDGFHKKVSNFTTTITTQTEILGFPFDYTHPVNLNESTIKGFEFTFNYQFANLPSPFDGLGMAFNYTGVQSSTSIDPQVLKTGNGQLFAVPGIGDSANLSGYYEKGPWQARLAVNWRDQYLSCLSCGPGSQPWTTKAYAQLDMSASYKVNENLSVFVEGTNLTREDVQVFQVYQNRPVSTTFDGRTFAVGVRGTW
jgi:TonB-dependent receptor